MGNQPKSIGMAGKPITMSKLRQIIRMLHQGRSQKSIHLSTRMSINTIKAYRRKLKKSGKPIDYFLSQDELSLSKFFSSGDPAYKDIRYEQMKELLPSLSQELGKKGVTKGLLWQEYIEGHPDGYKYSQFCFHLRRYMRQKHPNLPLDHLPADKLYIDYAGATLPYIDAETGEVINCQVFVACLPYSDYCFAMAVPSQTTDDFIFALKCCLEHLGGVPKALVPDNLKAAVVQTNRYEPKINRVLEDFANHYGTVVVPARPRKPQDKALVENQVKLIYQRAYARMRNQQYFSLQELNNALISYIGKHNQTRMQKRDYCRTEQFVSKEKPLLSSLPDQPFEIKYYRNYTVAQNGHVLMGIDQRHYSVPFEYIGQKAQLIYTDTIVNIFVQSKLVATHRRNKTSGYTTNKDHLCSQHQHYRSRSTDNYLKKASMCPELERMMEVMISKKQYPEQLFRSFDGLLNLMRSYPKEHFETAIRMAIEAEQYNYTFVQNVLRNKTYINSSPPPQTPLPQHENTRGKSYYN
ncbi:transposase (plasmid) [Persicobacter psychrovividus]|uniref:Transposase n=2 Tax=Persicobacter psychrovividus TaxID=387638 RepID=A0ABM7VJY4_9BACT|nr:transposase [Persicobacter psychrovividus]